MAKKSKNKWQFGDFQTPSPLAQQVVEKIAEDESFRPGTILEPSCGLGSFLVAASNTFPHSELLGFDVNPQHVESARQSVMPDPRTVVQVSDFFQRDWVSTLSSLKGPLLILGNPPWVTSSELGILNSTNLPGKCNFEGRTGIEAITGSSNFDISEWMLLRYVDWLSGFPGKMAVLCKYSVARKIFRSLPKQTGSRFIAEIFPIDAKEHFGAAVEACLFTLTNTDQRSICSIFTGLTDRVPNSTIALRNSQLVRNVDAFDRWKSLAGQDARYVWRSGIKHDCSRVMELRLEDGILRNGLDEIADVEMDHLFPLLKSSDIANGRNHNTMRRYMLVTQHYVGEDTSDIALRAPQTWRYLCRYGEILDARTSKVYKGKTRFAVFGVGQYSFAPWKIAISGLYKHLTFALIGPCNGRPVVFDDTVYFIACESENEALFVLSLLNSEPASEFLQSLIF